MLCLVECTLRVLMVLIMVILIPANVQVKSDSLVPYILLIPCFNRAAVFPLRILRMGQFYKFVHKSWWPCAKSINFWLRNGWMNKRITFFSPNFYNSLEPICKHTEPKRVATYRLRGSTVEQVTCLWCFIFGLFCLIHKHVQINPQLHCTLTKIAGQFNACPIWLFHKQRLLCVIGLSPCQPARSRCWISYHVKAMTVITFYEWNTFTLDPVTTELTQANICPTK